MALFIIGILIALVYFGFLYLKYSKAIFNSGNALLVTGGLKTGKTQLCVMFIFVRYRIALLKYYFGKFLNVFRSRKNKKYYEKPLIYSNMPIGRLNKDKYVPLTLDHILRKVRLRYGSVVYLNEMSLIAGSKDIYDEDINDEINQFIKLYCHETHNGYVVIDTQSPMDCHYAAKRSVSTYYHIYRRKNYFFKLFSILYIREKELVDGDHSVAINNMDPDDSKHDGKQCLYVVFMFNRKWWKRYDRWAYSSFTDDLPVDDNAIVVTSQKMTHLVRLRDLKKNKNKEVSKNEKTKNT